MLWLVVVQKQVHVGEGSGKLLTVGPAAAERQRRVDQPGVGLDPISIFGAVRGAEAEPTQVFGHAGPPIDLPFEHSGLRLRRNGIEDIFLQGGEDNARGTCGDKQEAAA
mmetsp:Transcript_56074/g.110647  ORF Transcript_56074/g.110647 Transcript_56074/m.110647 type:complete len:109 (+) Transcript_56074:413-739(+)